MSRKAKQGEPAEAIEAIEPIEALDPAATIGDAMGTFDQAAIDAMFGGGGDDAAPVSGLRALLDSRTVSHERLPMLEVVGERMVRALGTSIRGLSADPIDMNLQEIVSVRFGDFMDRLPQPTMIGVVRFMPWQGYGLVSVDTSLIYAIVDALLGGSALGATTIVDGRPFTAIEMALVAKMVRLVLGEFCKAFSAVGPLEASLERFETNPRFAAIASTSNVAAAIRLRFDMNRSGGCLTLLLPYATLEPVRDRLSQRFMGEQQGPTNLWRAHMEAEILKTSAELSVVMGERMMPLEKVMGIAVGDTIPFGTPPDAPMDIRCRGVRLGTAQVGHRRGRIAISPLNAIASEARP